MFVTKALLAGAFAVVVCAQSAVLTFTNVPNPVTDGQPQAITYSTNDTTTPVTIRLRRGTSTNLQTVSTLTESALNGQFIWTPPADLPNGNDYALQIIQNDQINYFGPFTVQGASPQTSSSSTSSEEVTGSVTILPIPFPIATTAVSDAGSMTTLVATANGTAYVAPIGTGVSSGMANGTMVTRNGTTGMATMTTTGTATTGGSTVGQTTAGATEGTTGGAGGSSTTSSQAEDSTGAAVAFQAEGALALVIGAAAFFL